MTRRQSLRDISGAVSGSAAIIASISSSVILRMRSRSARGLDLGISLRERLTVGTTFSPLRRSRGNNPAAVAAPRVHNDECFRSDFPCGDDSALAIVEPPVLFFDHRSSENAASIIKVESTLRVIAGTLRLAPLKQRRIAHPTGFTYRRTTIIFRLPSTRFWL